MRRLWALLGYLTYFFTHLFQLSSVPGLHFDEAWFAVFARRIAFEPGFWPLYAMSAQTRPWSHYWSAFIFRILGDSVWVYRTSCIALSFLGVVFIAEGLKRSGRFYASAFFPWIAALSPALVLNHRFGIELTSIHTFCFGAIILLSTSMERKNSSRTAQIFFVAAAWIGVSSHVLYLAVIAAWVICDWVQGRHYRREWTWLGILQIPLALQLLLYFPEKDKATLFAVSTGLLLIGAPLTQLMTRTIAKHFSPIKKTIMILGLAPTLITLFLWEGSWQILFQLGNLHFTALVGIALIVSVTLAVQALKKELRKGLSKGQRSKVNEGLVLDLKNWGFFIVCISVCLIAVAPKPTGRYFETALLSVAIFLSLSFEAFESRHRQFFSVLLLGAQAGVLGFNYFLPAMNHSYLDRGYRFLFFHDSSRDFAPVLDSNTLRCSRDQIHAEDSRIHQILDFLVTTQNPPADCADKSWTAQRTIQGISLVPSTYH